MPKLIADEPKSKKTGVKTLRAGGVTCGIGSMLVGAKQAGFDVVGNIEWRKYYHHEDEDGCNTFLENFEGAIFPFRLDDMDQEQVDMMTGLDLIMGHPECGNFSVLGGSNKDRSNRLKDPCDIPLFVDLIAKLRPRFFVMDDLPKSFGAFSMEEYSRRLPDYDLYPEWVSNHGYGNVQKFRNRMFMIGSLRSEKWVFVPGEEENNETVESVIGDLADDGTIGEYANHDPHEMDSQSGRFIHMPSYGDRPTWREFAEYIRDFPEGANFPYEKEDGSTKVRIGSCKVRWTGSSAVLHGGNPILHPLRCLPLTIRERARIQGFPDEFVFYGTKFDDDGLWNHEKNLHMVKQTGKAMPVQFCRYVARQIAAFIRGEEFRSSGARLLKNNHDVDRAKKWYCENVGYSDQEQACGRCWLYDGCGIRTALYGIGEPPIGRGHEIVQGDSASKTTNGKKDRKMIKTKTQKTTDKTRGPSIPAPEGSIEIIEIGPGINRPRPVPVVTIRKERPADYHCGCHYCSRIIGELRPKDGSYYSRLERREYYDPVESGGGGHIAKTPLHIARWAVQRYTRPGDWVLDPTAGAGTTLVESLIQGRNAMGIELEFGQVIETNVRKNTGKSVQAVVGIGDARLIGTVLGSRKFSLVQNNPPYFGDQSFPSPAKEGVGPEFRHLETTFKYDQTLPNLGLLKEGVEYWSWIESIYRECIDHLTPRGKFVVGVKDQMRNRQPDQLHEKFGDLLSRMGLSFVGTAFLKHHPTTLHLNTYHKRYGVHPPYYQSILVFSKGK